MTRRLPPPQINPIQVAANFARSFLQRSTFDPVWNALRELGIERYGRFRPLRNVVNDDVTAAAEEFVKDQNLLFGDRARKLAGYMSMSGGICHLSVLMDVSWWRPTHLDWFVRLAEAAPMLFGHLSSVEEFDAKHRTVREYEKGSVRGQVGATIWELPKYLPGVYSVTLLGPELVSGLDVSAARRLPDVTVRDLDGGQAMLQVGSEPLVHGAEIETRLEQERGVAAALGDEFFFDRDRTARELRQVPAFTAALEARRTDPAGTKDKPS